MDGIITRRCDNQALFYLAVAATAALGLSSLLITVCGFSTGWVAWNSTSEVKPKQDISFGLFQGCRGAFCDDLDLDSLYKGETAHALRALGAVCVLSMIACLAAFVSSVLMLLKIKKKYRQIPNWKKLANLSALSYSSTCVCNIIVLIVFDVTVYRKYFDYDFLMEGAAFIVYILSIVLISPIVLIILPIFACKYDPEMSAPGSTHMQTITAISTTVCSETTGVVGILPQAGTNRLQQQQQHPQQEQQGQTPGNIFNETGNNHDNKSTGTVMMMKDTRY